MNAKLESLQQAANEAEICLLIPEPMCCRSCVVPTLEDKVIIDNPNLPYLWVFLSDNSANDLTFWQEANQDTGYIYHDRLSPRAKADLREALLKHFKYVEMPDNNNEAIEVGLWKGTK